MPASANARLAPPSSAINTDSWKILASAWMREANQGHLSNVGTFTCLSGTAQTVLTDARIGIATFIGFMPKTANAAAESPYVTSQSKGAATIVHANAVTGDRTFTYTVLG